MKLIDADELLQDPYFQDKSIPERLLFIEAVESAPTINPEDLRPKGRWTWVQYNESDGHTYAECSNCHKVRVADNFCSNCGTEMTEEA